MLPRSSAIVIFLVVQIGPAAVYAQSFPSKPIRIIATEPGANLDFQARIIAQAISGPLGQPVIVENKSSVLAPEALARATPDGYTVAIGAGAMWLTQLTQKTSYDALRDYAPITWSATYPFMLVVHPSVPAKSVRELIDLAKAKPGMLNIGATASPGGSSFLAAELLKAMAGVNIVRVSYKGNASAHIGLMANEVQVMVNNLTETIPQVKAGKLRGLGVTSLEPTALAPGVPTLSATGLPGYEVLSISGILAPAGTPAANVNRLHREIVQAINRADVKDRFFTEGIEIVGSSPEQFAAKIKAEMGKWGRVLKDAGVKVEM